MSNFAQGIGGEFHQGFDGGFPAYGIESRGHGDRTRSADEAPEMESDA